eukprot:scaffold27275_cov242-Isochrysis_galbana.AAC.1
MRPPAARVNLAPRKGEVLDLAKRGQEAGEGVARDGERESDLLGGRWQVGEPARAALVGWHHLARDLWLPACSRCGQQRRQSLIEHHDIAQRGAHRLGHRQVQGAGALHRHPPRMAEHRRWPAIAPAGSSADRHAKQVARPLGWREAFAQSAPEREEALPALRYARGWPRQASASTKHWKAPRHNLAVQSAVLGRRLIWSRICSPNGQTATLNLFSWSGGRAGRHRSPVERGVRVGEVDQPRHSALGEKELHRNGLDLQKALHRTRAEKTNRADEEVVVVAEPTPPVYRRRGQVEHVRPIRQARRGYGCGTPVEQTSADRSVSQFGPRAAGQPSSDRYCPSRAVQAIPRGRRGELVESPWYSAGQIDIVSDSLWRVNAKVRE